MRHFLIFLRIILFGIIPSNKKVASTNPNVLKQTLKFHGIFSDIVLNKISGTNIRLIDKNI